MSRLNASLEQNVLPVGRTESALPPQTRAEVIDIAVPGGRWLSFNPF